MFLKLCDKNLCYTNNKKKKSLIMLNYDYYKFYIFEDFDKKIGDQNSDKSKSYRFFHKYYSRTLKKKKKKKQNLPFFFLFIFKEIKSR